MRCCAWNVRGYYWHVRSRVGGYQRGMKEVRGEEALD